MSSTMTDAVSRTTSEQIERANATDRTPVVFVHGLWLLPSSWDRWATLFEEAGYTALTPGWPDDPETVAEANANPTTFARKGVGDVADHFDALIRTLDRKPAVIGHSFGGLLAQIIAGRGLSAATVAIDPAPFRGVPEHRRGGLQRGNRKRKHANWNRAVTLSVEQFKYGWANALSDDEAKQ